MMLMGVQGRDQRGSFPNDTEASVLVTVNVTLVPLGTPREPFQIQVVPRKVGHVFADEEAGGKGVHGPGHRLPHRMVGPLEASLQRTKESPTLFPAAAVRIQSGCDVAEVFDTILQGLLLLLDLGEASVNGVG
jgi:hypothetical protein